MNHDSEEHYHEQMMLYTSWRNKEKDLMKGQDSYESRFLTCHNFFRQIWDNGLHFPGFASIFWDRPPPLNFFFSIIGRSLFSAMLKPNGAK